MFASTARGRGGGGVEEKMITVPALDLRPLREDGGGEGAQRVFECKTCSRRFPTFQALGGHRTSHGRPRCGGGGGGSSQSVQLQRQMLKMKPRLHACPVCGLAFPMGQALGGHMRRHRATAGAASGDQMQFNAGGGAAAETARKLQWLDLNLPPLEDELQLRCVGVDDEFGGEEMIESSPSSSTNNYLSASYSSYSA